jgi:beta-glucanase (GH16 family)
VWLGAACAAVLALGATGWHLASAPSSGASREILNDQFTDLDPTKWNTFLTSRAANGSPWEGDGAGGSGQGAFDADYFLPSQVTTGKGLVITAAKQETNAHVNRTTVVLPWRSGVVSTYGKVEFSGGTVEIRAKLPDGNGLWPAFWMLPGAGATHGDDYEIDMFEGGFTGNGVPATHNHAWHAIVGGKRFGGVTDTGTDLTSGYHVYGLTWKPGESLTWSLDGQQIGRLTTDTCPIANEPMEIIIGLSVANTTAAAWHTTFDESTPQTAQLDVSDIRIREATG